MHARRATLALLALAAGCGPLAAARAATTLETTLGGLSAQPFGPLGGASRAGLGMSGALEVRSDSVRGWALRVDAGFTSQPVGDEVALHSTSGDLSTSYGRVSNRVQWATAGPQMERRFGRGLGYLFATAGIGRTEAHPSVRSTGTDSYYPESFDSPPHGLTFAWTAGGGWRVPLGRGLGLDLGLSFVGLGRSPLAADPPLVLGRDRREHFQLLSPDPLASLGTLRIGLALGSGGGTRHAERAPRDRGAGEAAFVGPPEPPRTP